MAAKYTAALVRNVLLALVVAVGLGGVFLYLQGPPAGDPASPAAHAGPSPPEGMTTDPERWRAAFPLEPATIDEGATSPPSQALTRALEPYRKRDFQSAASELEGVWIDNPDEHRAALYLGISRLFIDEVPAAIEVLRQAQASPDPQTAAAAGWYVLVGIARLREPASGIAEVREVCERPGPYSARACHALEELMSRRP